MDRQSGGFVCTISGHCFDRLLSPEEELVTSENVSVINFFPLKIIRLPISSPYNLYTRSRYLATFKLF